jgi:2-C-methyl-D-erythritol 2,4-cyclodiphosphate synthase
VRTRVGLGFDVHPFADGRALVLGGVTIDDPDLNGRGLDGHSDADVVAHAVADAVLGAAGLDDLGTLFPADDEQHRGASSIELLREVAALVVKARWWIANVDVVVAAEQPKLAPYVAEMSTNLSAALERTHEPMGLPLRVSVKPKRAEGLGAIGRSEGIAAWAVALLERA